MNADDYPLLHDLVSPTPVREFLEQYWPERHLASHGRIERLPKLFRSGELESFRALTERYSGRVIFGKGTTGPRTINTVGLQPAHLYEMGLTVQLADIQRRVPGMDALLRQLERELGIPAGSASALAFASPQADGVSCHFDAEDVFSIQLQGSKRFHVAPVTDLRYPLGVQFGPRMPAFDDLYPQAGNGFPCPDDAAFETIEMKPGSVLFMPRGTWHRTDADSDSFSVSLSLSPPSAMDCAIRELRNLMLQDPQWRRPLYGAWSDGPARTTELGRARELLSQLPALAGNITENDLVARTVSERLQQIGRNTRFQRNPDTRIEMEPGVESLMLRIAVWDFADGEKITMQGETQKNYRPPLQWLADSRTAFSAGELADRFPALSFNDHRAILESLTRASFLKLLWFRPLSS